MASAWTPPPCSWSSSAAIPGRLRSGGARASLSAAAPIPASSGKVARYRLNRGGDRQANHALCRRFIVIPELAHIGAHVSWFGGCAGAMWARISSLEMAVAAGDVTGWPLARFTHQSRIRALVFAADHQRLDVIDQLIEASTPVNEADAEWERLPPHTAAGNGRAASVRRLLAHGADPNLRDPRHHRTPLEECQPASSPGHREVEAILGPLRSGNSSVPVGAQ